MIARLGQTDRNGALQIRRNISFTRGSQPMRVTCRLSGVQAFRCIRDTLATGASPLGAGENVGIPSRGSALAAASAVIETKNGLRFVGSAVMHPSRRSEAAMRGSRHKPAGRLSLSSFARMVTAAPSSLRGSAHVDTNTARWLHRRVHFGARPAQERQGRK
jgi:hypothetical protein